MMVCKINKTRNVPIIRIAATISETNNCHIDPNQPARASTSLVSADKLGWFAQERKQRRFSAKQSGGRIARPDLDIAAGEVFISSGVARLPSI